MITSKKKVNDLCDKLMKVNPHQIVIDLVQEEIDELIDSDEVTPDDIGAAAYKCGLLLEVYKPDAQADISYLIELESVLRAWEHDATFANKALGLDPNQ